jgi:hypothetical protein
MARIGGCGCRVEFVEDGEGVLPGKACGVLIAGVVVAVAEPDADVGLASPALADTDGPTLIYYGGMCLTPQGNAPWQGTLIVQAPCDIYTTGVRNLMQEWTGVCTNSSCSAFHYINRGSGRCMRARGPNGVALGLQIMLWDCDSISDNNWVYRSTSVPGTYSMESRLANSHGYCLDVPGGSTSRRRWDGRRVHGP